MMKLILLQNEAKYTATMMWNVFHSDSLSVPGALNGPQHCWNGMAGMDW
jgi:hypothetical protein